MDRQNPFIPQILVAHGTVVYSTVDPYDMCSILSCHKIVLEGLSWCKESRILSIRICIPAFQSQIIHPLIHFFTIFATRHDYCGTVYQVAILLTLY